MKILLSLIAPIKSASSGVEVFHLYFRLSPVETLPGL